MRLLDIDSDTNVEFNNREISIAAWSLLALALVAWKMKPWRPLAGIARALMNPRIVLVVSVAVAFVGGLVWSLARIGVWKTSDLKTTILWGIAFALYEIFRTRPERDNRSYWGLTKESFGIAALLTFVSEFHSYSLLVELLVTPLLMISSVALVIAERDKKLRTVEALAKCVLALGGLASIVYSLRQIGAAPEELFSAATLKDYGVPTLLSFAFLPFLFALAAYMTYEEVFVRLKLFVSDKKLVRQAKWKSVLSFRFDLDGLRKWMRHFIQFRIRTREDLDASIAETLAVRRREIRPHQVPPLVGWPPDKAKNYLAEVGLVTSEYRRVDHNDWSAISNNLEIDESLLPSYVTYYVYGDAYAAHRLRLVLNINEQSTEDKAVSKFIELVQQLVQKIAQPKFGAKFDFTLESDGAPREFLGNLMTLKKDEWRRGSRTGKRFELTIDCKDFPGIGD